MNRYQRDKILSKNKINGTRGIRYYRGVKYPEIPLSPDDIYVYAESGDRFDILANSYYGDSTLWWIISTANNFLSQDSYYIPLGVQIRIPINTSVIQSSFNNLNSLN
jgi:hypothetical protein